MRPQLTIHTKEIRYRSIVKVGMYVSKDGVGGRRRRRNNSRKGSSRLLQNGAELTETDRRLSGKKRSREWDQSRKLFPEP
jgi:hypothetical protein